jgi:hypothetical protein
MCDRDHLLSEHVIALHRGAKDDEPSQRPGSSRIGKHNGHEHARTLAQRLELTAGQVRDKSRRNETKPLACASVSAQVSDWAPPPC